MPTPRPYISFSQMTLFERDPELYIQKYIYDQEQRTSKNMDFGSALAEGLESDESTGDPVLDLMASRLPKFELMDKPIEADLKDGRKTIKLLAKPDTCKKDMTAFKEYKTSTRKWTQKMVDDSGQITFYATTIWLNTGKIPQDIELVCVKTAYGDQGQMTVTGEMFRYPTKRTITDCLKMTARIRRVWHQIQERCEKELLT